MYTECDMWMFQTTTVSSDHVFKRIKISSSRNINKHLVERFSENVQFRFFRCIILHQVYTSICRCIPVWYNLYANYFPKRNLKPSVFSLFVLFSKRHQCLWRSNGSQKGSMDALKGKEQQHISIYRWVHRILFNRSMKGLYKHKLMEPVTRPGRM